MNKNRRKQIADIAAKVEELKSQLEAIDLAELRDEEQDYFDNMPESMQGGDKGQAAEAAVDALNEAVDAINEAIDSLGNAVGRMEDAQS